MTTRTGVRGYPTKLPRMVDEFCHQLHPKDLEFLCPKISGIFVKKTIQIDLGVFGCFKPINPMARWKIPLKSLESMLIFAVARWFV